MFDQTKQALIFLCSGRLRLGQPGVVAAGVHLEGLAKAQREPLLPPSEVKARYLKMTQLERQEFDATLGDMVVGSPESCHEKIQELAQTFGSDEIGVVTVTHRLEDRIQSYRLLANAHGLSAK